jgi:hypothetical protein
MKYKKFTDFELINGECSQCNWCNFFTMGISSGFENSSNCLTVMQSLTDMWLTMLSMIRQGINSVKICNRYLY